jgi:hypothetical protein
LENPIKEANKGIPALKAHAYGHILTSFLCVLMSNDTANLLNSLNLNFLCFQWSWL